jgi:hypothetical protein
VAVRATGFFNIATARGIVRGVAAHYCHFIYRADGYGSSYQKGAALSPSGVNAGASAPIFR